jgi:PII-like signaling protein
LRARELGLAWAAVFRGVMGYGFARCLRAAGLFAPLHELPFVVEILDRDENVWRQLPFFDARWRKGLSRWKTWFLRAPETMAGSVAHSREQHDLGR